MKIDRNAFAKGRLIAKPGKKHFDEKPAQGLPQLGLDRQRDGMLYTPAAYRPDTPSPCMVIFTGQGEMQHMGGRFLSILPIQPTLFFLHQWQEARAGTLLVTTVSALI
ncbi:MAG: Phospholipase [Segetibacter sp.]|nr:Phospholipase [Segetibacter sp.]